MLMLAVAVVDMVFNGPREKVFGRYNSCNCWLAAPDDYIALMGVVCG